MTVLPVLSTRTTGKARGRGRGGGRGTAEGIEYKEEGMADAEEMGKRGEVGWIW